MNIYVLDKSFKIIDLIDEYESVIWATRYFTYGDFELVVSPTKKHIDLLQKDYYLVREQDRIGEDEFHNVMVIRNFELTTDVENGDKLIVKGPCLKSILKRRVIVNQTILNGKVDNSIRQLVNENIVNPSDPTRQIANFTFGTNILTNSYNMSLQVTGDNLQEVVTEICTTYGYGYDIYIKNKQFVFYLYEGVDRSYLQNKNPHVEFSSEYDNLITSNYISNSDKYANVAIVAGEGEGISRKKAVAGNISGLERFEIYVDSRNTSTNEGAVSEEEYNKMLIEEGNETLKESIATTQFEGEIGETLNYQINKDYFLGDLVQIENDYGINARTRIVEVIESEDETGTVIVPTFSNMEGV